MQSVKAICAVGYTAVKGGKKIMTNREWLRSLSDSELAEFLYDDKWSIWGGICNMCVYGDSICVEHGDQECRKGITKWLQRECEK